VVRNVVVQDVRLSDAVKRADTAQMGGDCNLGEALDEDGHHVRAHQVAFWAAKLPNSEAGSHADVLIDNLVSMNSRVRLQNSGDDCLGIWSTGITGMRIVNVTAKVQSTTVHSISTSAARASRACGSST